MLQVDGLQEDDEVDDDDDDDADEDEEDDDNCEQSSEPIAAASSYILLCLGCRQESWLEKNVECNICREKLEVNFYGRNIQFDCNSCKTYLNKRIRCSNCKKDEWKY